MVNISLSEQEVALIRKSINNCLDTCNEGGPDNKCGDCQSLEQVLGQLPNS